MVRESAEQSLQPDKPFGIILAAWNWAREEA
jgi:hypothetical protein